MTTSARANELFVETRRADAHTIVTVTGRVTVDSSPHLRPVLHEAIAAAPPGGVVIDFTAARYLDTWGIATLLEAATLASKRGVPRDMPGVVNGLAAAVRVTVDRLVTDMELQLGRAAAPRDVR